jgi:sugar phosphate permease
MIATGAGVALSFPMLFSAAGKEGAIALTTVASFGYVGGMVSQPIMGWVVETFDLAGGFLFVAAVTLIIGILASKARLLAPTH